MVSAEPQKTSPASFEVMHQRLGHAGAYQLKDLQLYAAGVSEIIASEDFQ